MLLRRTAVVAMLVLVAVATGCSTVRPTGAPSGRTPVIFVHGWSGSASQWDTAVNAFVAAGYTRGDITQISYDSNQSAADAAADLASEIDYLREYTGAARVDVVSHSFGSMVTRYCIELGGCRNEVRRWMSLAGADNGTSISLSCAFFSAACRDMAGQTDVISRLQASWSQISTQNVRVEVQWSNTDGTIIPATNSQNPAPATNVRVPDDITHLEFLDDQRVIDETLRFLR